MRERLTLTEFLDARLTEAERRAHYATTRTPMDWTGHWIGDVDHYGNQDPARVQADCRAKRNIIAMYEQARVPDARLERDAEVLADSSHATVAPTVAGDVVKALHEVLLQLAGVYSSHPAYTPERWA